MGTAWRVESGPSGVGQNSEWPVNVLTLCEFASIGQLRKIPW